MKQIASYIKIFRNSLVTLFLAWPIWMLAQHVFQTGKGLELTDEGTYLLSANPSHVYDFTLFPWGWHTRVLFAASKFNISDFRTTGAVLLFYSGFFMSLIIFQNLFVVKNEMSDYFIKTFLSIFLGFCTWFGYSGYNRTPGYNFVNELGLQISISGFILVSQSIKDLRKNNMRLNFGYLILSFGVFFTLPAKPSTGIVLILGLSIFIWLENGIKDATKFLKFLILYTSIWISAALLSGVWPLHFLQDFIYASRTPFLVQNQSVVGVLKNILNTPYELFKVNIGLKFIVIIFTFSLVSRKMPKIYRHFLIYFILSCITLRIYFAQISFFAHEGESHYIFIPMFALFLTIAAVLWIFLTEHFEKSEILMLTLFIICPFIPGLGSSHGIAGIATLNMALIITAILLMCSKIPSNLHRRIIGLVIVMISSFSLTAVLVDGSRHPFRQEHFSSQTNSIQIGAGKSNKLLVGNSEFNLLTELRSQVIKNGWVPGMKMVALLWGNYHSTTIPYFLGATTFPGLEVTISGNGVRSEKFGKFSLQKLNRNFASKSWLLISKESSIPSSEKSVYRTLLTEILEKSGKKLHDDYQLAAAYETIEIWKPNF